MRCFCFKELSVEKIVLVDFCKVPVFLVFCQVILCFFFQFCCREVLYWRMHHNPRIPSARVPSRNRVQPGIYLQISFDKIREEKIWLKTYLVFGGHLNYLTKSRSMQFCWRLDSSRFISFSSLSLRTSKLKFKMSKFKMRSKARLKSLMMTWWISFILPSSYLLTPEGRGRERHAHWLQSLRTDLKKKKVLEHHQTVECPRKGTPGWWATVWCTSSNL